ncbi:MAG: ABC transporter substrate-binding protein [Clostridiales bacterium]|nr:ABC transporter substrate-binding protein [Clostridiales bacterium]
MGKRKKILTMLLTLMFVLFTVGCGNTEGNQEANNSEDTTVKILLGKESLCLAPVHIAIINGYFDEEFNNEGLKYELVEAEVNQAADLLTARKINAAYGLTGSLIQPISNGLNISFTTGLHTGCTKYYIKKGSNITSLQDFKGKTIGVPSLSDSSVVNLKRKLNNIGLNMKKNSIDVEFVAYAMSDLPAALDNGAVDVIGIHDPVATKAENSYGFTKILDTTTDEKFIDEYCCQAYVSRELIEKNKKGAEAYTRAMQKAAAFIEAEPEEAARLQIEKGYMSGDAKSNGAILASFSYEPSISKGRKTFESSFEELQKIGDIDSSLDLEKYTENSYVKLDNVPDGVVYSKETKTFSEIN